jgi:hypothetical protein
VHLRFTPQARFWGKVRNDRVVKTAPAEGQNPIAPTNKPKNAAQPWLCPRVALGDSAQTLRGEPGW